MSIFLGRASIRFKCITLSPLPHFRGVVVMLFPFCDNALSKTLMTGMKIGKVLTYRVPLTASGNVEGALNQ